MAYVPLMPACQLLLFLTRCLRVMWIPFFMQSRSGLEADGARSWIDFCQHLILCELNADSERGVSLLHTVIPAATDMIRASQS